jgi:hypothetical protein
LGISLEQNIKLPLNSKEEEYDDDYEFSSWRSDGNDRPLDKIN